MPEVPRLLVAMYQQNLEKSDEVQIGEWFLPKLDRPGRPGAMELGRQVYLFVVHGTNSQTMD